MLALPSNLKVRRARDMDLPEMARIHSAAYPNVNITLQERMERFRTNPRISLEDHWVCKKDDNLVGMFSLYDFSMYRAGKTIPAGGIGSVAVAAEARRERIAYWMMMKSIEVMDQNNVPLSILYPFRHSFYRHLGWGLIGRINLYRLSPESLPNFPERKFVRPVVTLEMKERVMECYRKFALRQNGTLMRHDPYWLEIVFKNAECFVYESPDSHEVEGYITFRYRPHPPDQAFMTTDIEVWDFVWNSRQALHGLLGFLAVQKDQVKVIILPDQSDLPLDQILSEPIMPDGRHNFILGAETFHRGSGLMGRVVQIRRALKALGKMGEASGTVNLNIVDELNPANSEPLTIELGNGNLEFKKSHDAPFTLKTDIATFSSIYWGALKMKDALLLNLVELEGKGDASFLTQMFNAPRPMCLDHF